MTNDTQTASDLRLLAPPTDDEVMEWTAAANLSFGDFYRIAAGCRLGVLPNEVTIEQRSLMKVTCLSANYRQNKVFS